MAISTALIPAAGKGSRLGRMGLDTPKCLFTVGERTILEHLLRILIRAGSEHFVIVLGHCGEAIENAAADGFDLDAKVEFVEQTSGKGNAYAVRSAAGLLGDKSYFYCDSDILFRPELAEEVGDYASASSEWDAILCFGRNPKIAPTHKSARAFERELADTAMELQVDLESYVLMGFYALTAVLTEQVQTELPNASADEISMSDVIHGSAPDLKIVAAFYEGAWWHLAYPRDLKRVRQTLDALGLRDQ